MNSWESQTHMKIINIYLKDSLGYVDTVFIHYIISLIFMSLNMSLSLKIVIFIYLEPN